MPFVACSNLDGYRVSCVKFIKYYMCFYNNTMDFHKMRQNSAVGVGSLALDSTLVRLGPPPVAVLVQPHPAQAQPSGKVLRHAP